MKNLVMIALIVVSLTTVMPAFGKSRPAPKPELSAKMEEQDADGHVLNENYEFRLDMYAGTGSKGVGSLVLTESPGQIFCIKAPCLQPPTIQTKYRVYKSQRDGCGSTHHFGVMTANFAIARGFSSIELTDHSTRTCKDYRKWTWEAKVSGRKTARLFFGSPVRDVKVDTCLEDLQNLVCIMVYLPAKCEASTMDDGATKIETIYAEGSNSCHAINLLKAEACKRGFDSERLTENDILCKVQQDPMSVPQAAPPALIQKAH